MDPPVTPHHNRREMSPAVRKISRLLAGRDTETRHGATRHDDRQPRHGSRRPSAMCFPRPRPLHDFDRTVARGIVGLRAGPAAAGSIRSACSRCSRRAGSPRPIRTVVTVEGVLTAARQAGYPVVLKGAGPALLHKTEAGVIYTGLASEGAVAGRISRR